MRQHRALFSADHPEHTGEREVIGVVSRARGERSVLPVPRDATVHEAWVIGAQRVGAEAQALHDARAQPLQHHVDAAREAPRDREIVGLFEVQRDRAFAAPEEITRVAEAERCFHGPIHADHVGAEIGQDHPRERRRPNRFDLEHPQVRERSPSCAHAVASSDSASAEIRLSSSLFSLVKGGASWMVSPP